MIKCIWDWFGSNSNALTGLASLFGVVIAFVGFWLTIKQLRQAQFALKAGNMYTIQKDARELIQKMTENSSFNDFVADHNPQKKYTKKTMDEANRCLAVMFNFYLSVFRQYKTKGISNDFAQSVGRDFSNFLSNETVQAHYKKQMEAKVYDEEHQAMVELWGSSRT